MIRRLLYRARFYWFGLRIWWRERRKLPSERNALRWQFEAAYMMGGKARGDAILAAWDSDDLPGESLYGRIHAYYENPPTMTYRGRDE